MSMFFTSEIVLQVVSAVGGAGALHFGLAGYLKASSLARQQAQLSAELEETKGQIQKSLEELKLDSERLKFAHAKQFEKEFKLYEDLWEKLWHLNASTKRLAGDHDREFESRITNRDVVKETQEAAMKAYEPVARLVEHFAPFFHGRVHCELKQFEGMCFKAWADDSYSALADKDVPAITSEDIDRQLQRICEAIRWRIGLSSIEWKLPNVPPV